MEWIRWGTALVAAVLAAALPLQAAPRFNEILANPTGTDDNREFIELRDAAGASANGLWVLQLDGNGTSVGSITEAWPLSGTFGANGLLLIGNNYGAAPKGGPWSAVIDSATPCIDPSGFAKGDLPNDTVTWLLVSQFSGSVGQDLDTNDDGFLDVNPWVLQHDAIGWSDGGSNDVVYAAAALEQSGGTPDAASRLRWQPDSLAADAWCCGNTTDAVDPLGGDYDITAVSDNLPAGARLTPGAANIPADPPSPHRVVLNEVYINPPNTYSNDNREFIELRSVSGSAESLYDLWILIVDSSGASIGRIDEAWCLNRLWTGTNGLILLGNRYDTPVDCPWTNTLAPGTIAAEPLNNWSNSTGWGEDNIPGDFSFSVLLVSGFHGMPDDDLDTDDDFHLDVEPWDTLVDGVGQGAQYAPTLVVLGYPPDAVARVAATTVVGDPVAWYGGEIFGDGLTTIFSPYTAESFHVPYGGQLTPGAPNYTYSGDHDGDGLPDAWEARYFGHVTQLAAPNADSDFDGATHLEEYITGSNPTNPMSRFAISAGGGTGPEGWVMSWPALTGRTYRVYRAATPDGPWSALVTRPGSAGILSYTNPAAGSGRFFHTVGVTLP